MTKKETPKRNSKRKSKKRNRHTVDLSLDLASLGDILEDLNEVMPNTSHGEKHPPKRGSVFGNYLKDMPMFSDPSVTDPNHPTEHHGLPEFVVRCIQKIENMEGTVGLYRINGDASVDQKIR